MTLPAGSTHDRMTSPIAHTRALPQHTADDTPTGRHHANHLGDNAVSVKAFVSVTDQPAGRRRATFRTRVARALRETS